MRHTDGKMPHPFGGLWVPNATFVPSHLWLPAELIQSVTSSGRPIALEFAATTVGWQEVGGNVSTIETVVDRLKRYSLRQIATWVGQLTLALSLGPTAFSAKSQLEAHHRILERFLGSDEADRIVGKIRRNRGHRYDPERLCLFQERQTLNALKLAFLTIDTEAADGEPDARAFVEALFMLTDLIDRPYEFRP